MNNHDKSFDLLALIKFLSSRWLFLTILVVSGGLAGFLFTLIQAPVYESSASFGVTIDYTQTGALSDVQEDQAMRGVGSVLLSDSLIDETLIRVNSEGLYKLAKDEFEKNAFADRDDFRWVIHYRGTDPQRIFQITQNWTDSARDTFDLALIHAQIAEQYLKTLNDLQACYQGSSLQTSDNFCGFNTAEGLLAEITILSGKIEAEKEAAQGLFYALSVNLINNPEYPQRPIRYQTNLLVTSGALGVLLIGLIYLIIKFFHPGRTA